MNEYMKARYHKRRAEALEALGGKCAGCGSSEKLEIDHIDRVLKEDSLARLFTQAEARYKQELLKCQLLCGACHLEKTRSELSVEHGGGQSGKKNCKCKPCKERKNEYAREWKRKRKETLANSTG